METNHPNRNLVWEKVQRARNIRRPTAKQAIEEVFTNFVELHGDRTYGDDPSFICGLGMLEDHPVTIIAQEKGVQTEEKIFRNFGMPHPEGYRKAYRLMKQAEKFHRPIVCIIDTPGAYPGIGAEERLQANTIAQNLAMMSSLKTPIISIVLGEGGSGGALAIGMGDQVWMFENAIYSILSPEGFASILYKDASKAPEVAAVMKLTAQDLLEYRMIDKIIPEVEGGLHEDPAYSFAILKKELNETLSLVKQIEPETLVQLRYDKFRNIDATLYK